MFFIFIVTIDLHIFTLQIYTVFLKETIFMHLFDIPPQIRGIKNRQLFHLFIHIFEKRRA